MTTQAEEELAEFREAFEQFPDTYARRQFLQELDDLGAIAALTDLEEISALDFVKMLQDGSLSRGIRKAFGVARRLMGDRLSYMKWRVKHPSLDATGDQDYDWDVSSYAYRKWTDAAHDAQRQNRHDKLIKFCRELSERSGVVFAPADAYRNPKKMAAALFPDEETK